MDRLIELQNDIDDAKLRLEEAEESGELESRLEFALDLEKLEAEFFREKMKETGEEYE